MTTIKGAIERVFHASPTFSAGTLRVEGGHTIRFRGKFCANYCDFLELTGEWQEDPVYGPQFQVESVSYCLPETPKGLEAYLAKSEAFKGIGPATAKKLVEYAGSGDKLQTLLEGDLEELHKVTRISRKKLKTLSKVWKANESQNRIRMYLASFGLTMRQISKLVNEYGEHIVGILRQDPYQLISLLDGFGFKRVDDIARRMGTPKDHPGRLDAGIVHALQEEISKGHTWTKGADLIAQAGRLLELDALNGEELIRGRAKRLLDEEKVFVADGSAVSFSYLLESEKIIRAALSQQAWRVQTVIPKHGHGTGLVGRQQEAFQSGLKYVISVISGGAGTGKTTVISRLAMTYLEDGQAVALCAPTGKAAKRIQDLLKGLGVDLEARTIHRLMHYDGKAFNRVSLSEDHYYESPSGTQKSPAFDVVIVDEASMVDAPLMSELISRINFHRTRLILVGDHNQLPPVGPGNVLRDILKLKLAPSTILDQVHRQAGVLKTNCMEILNGKVAPTAEENIGWIVVDGLSTPTEIAAYLQKLIREKLPRRFNYDNLRDIQVLTPTHKGPLGTKELNKVMQYLFHGEVSKRFTVGDKVIQMSNDYDLGVMNGTIGYVQRIDPGMMHVEFEGVGSVMVDPEKQGNVNLAYALTVHKTQGSEFPCVILVMHRSHFFASRPLLYTGATRARENLIVLGDRFGIRRAAQKNEAAKRRTFLSRWHDQAGK